MKNLKIKSFSSMRDAEIFVSHTLKYKEHLISESDTFGIVVIYSSGPTKRNPHTFSIDLSDDELSSLLFAVSEASRDYQKSLDYYPANTDDEKMLSSISWHKKRIDVFNSIYQKFINIKADRIRRSNNE